MMGMDCVINAGKHGNPVENARKTCAFLAKKVGASKEDFPGQLKVKFEAMISE